MADVIVKPAFQSAFPDSGDATKFGPNAWNEARVFSGGVDGEVLVRSAASATGAAWSAAPVVSALTVNGVNGGGAIGTRATATTITAGTALYDVGLRLQTFGTADGTYSALDLDLLSETFKGGRAMRLFTNEAGTRSQVTYFSNAGALFTRTGITVSGSWTGSGEDTNITPPSLDPIMIGVWGDVIGGIQVRAANVEGPWLWEGLDRDGNRTSSIVEDGSIWLGAGATHASLDTGIKRVSAGLLEINNTVAGTLRDLRLRTLSAQDLFVTQGNLQIPNDTEYQWSNGTGIKSSLNAQINLLNNGGTAGVGLDVATDAILKIRTRAQTGYATVDALGYSVSGSAGASKAAGPVTSITVVNGIVTAIS